MHGFECAFKNQVRQRLQQLRPGPAHTPSSLHNIRKQQNWKAGCLCIRTHTYTQTLRNGGKTEQKRGSGGQVCKPHTPSRVTKVTKGMCTWLSPISLSLHRPFYLCRLEEHIPLLMRLYTIYLSIWEKKTQLNIITAKIYKVEKSRRIKARKNRRCCVTQRINTLDSPDVTHVTLE